MYEPLVSVPANEPMCRSFQRGLARRKVDWLPGIEVSTVDLVQTYVINGYGIGLAVAVPGMKYHPRIRLLPLAGFDPIDFGVLWQGKVTPILEACLEAIREAARDLSS
jgi:DNA-binding transcriptional LysR family regulator